MKQALKQLVLDISTFQILVYNSQSSTINFQNLILFHKSSQLAFVSVVQRRTSNLKYILQPFTMCSPFGKDASGQDTVTSLRNSLNSSTSQDSTSSNVDSSTTFLPSYKILTILIESKSAIDQFERSQKDDS